MAGFSWYLSEGFQVIIEKSKEAKCTVKDIQLRFLCPDDLEEVRCLCRDWFPIEYPQSWYEDITSSDRFFALAAVHKTQIIGLIVAEIKPYLKLNAEDRGILSRWFASKDTLVAYILSLGVVRSHRRSGVATMLLDVLINHLSGPVPQPPHEHRVKAIFLHVLTTNTEAIFFYEQRRFRLHSFLPYYYSIKGRCKDGFTYVYYVNGGHAPWGLYDYMKCVARAAWRGGGLYPWLWGKLRSALTIAWHRAMPLSAEQPPLVSPLCYGFHLLIRHYIHLLLYLFKGLGHVVSVRAACAARRQAVPSFSINNNSSHYMSQYWALASPQSEKKLPHNLAVQCVTQ